MTIIEQIKAEIERRKKALHCTLFNDEYNDLLSFLSTLESEHLADARKTSPNDLEEAAWGYASKECEKAAFIAGAKWQAEHTPLPEDTVLFNKGVAEGKRLMMQEAVEANVFGENYGSHRKVISEWLEPEIVNPGDKVRIIIVKED